VLLLGQLKFEDVGNDESRVLETPALDDLSRVIGVSTADICRVLTHRTVAAGSQHSVANLNLEKALYARDALAKSLYDRTFSWVVGRINEAIVRKDPNARNTVLGILDIYGFEIMKVSDIVCVCVCVCVCVVSRTNFKLASALAVSANRLTALSRVLCRSPDQLVRAVLHQLLQREAAAGLHRAHAQGRARRVSHRRD
jgi:hypothetical protein